MPYILFSIIIICAKIIIFFVYREKKCNFAENKDYYDKKVHHCGHGIVVSDFRPRSNGRATSPK